jgi:hypoxanthine phosphoribosyltransferase
MGIWQSLLIAVVGAALGIVGRWLIGIWERAILLRKLKNAMLNRERVSLNEEFLMTRLLAQKIRKDKFSPDVIFGICPGGAMIAEWLSRRFLGSWDKPAPMQVLYMVPEHDDDGAINMKVDEEWTAISPGMSKDAKVLVVNDITRTGDTLKVACNFLANHFDRKNIQSAVLVRDVQDKKNPTYHVAMTAKAVQFDWKTYSAD